MSISRTVLPSESEWWRADMSWAYAFSVGFERFDTGGVIRRRVLWWGREVR